MDESCCGVRLYEGVEVLSHDVYFVASCCGAKVACPIHVCLVEAFVFTHHEKCFVDFFFPEDVGQVWFSVALSPGVNGPLSGNDYESHSGDGYVSDLFKYAIGLLEVLLGLFGIVVSEHGCIEDAHEKNGNEAKCNNNEPYFGVRSYSP